MEPPDSLPGQVYLLAYDRGRGRVTERLWMGHILGGAALADLWLSGHLVDEGGRARAATGLAPPADPVLRELWERVGEVPPRKWVRWVYQRRVEGAVRAQLAAGGWVRVEPAAHWWRRDKVTVRDTLMLGRMVQQARSALRGPIPVDRLPAPEAVLVALVGTAELGTAFPRQLRRDNRKRLAAAVERGGPPIRALRSALQQAKHSGGG
ncbi:MAG TPA: GPP34 family phosphoprotein [Micromonosporaceae bacterium]|nr:GPP34 family phosphoprotein [Micromonosporaceae bacterium]